MVEYESPEQGQAEKETRQDSGETNVLAQEKVTLIEVAEDDVSETFFERGIRYSTGRDVIPDLIAAHMWFNLAAQRGHAAARSYRNDLAREMTTKEVAQAQREAREWIKCEQETLRQSQADVCAAETSTEETSAPEAQTPAPTAAARTMAAASAV
jgi:uncharacterized protein